MYIHKNCSKSCKVNTAENSAQSNKTRKMHINIDGINNYIVCNQHTPTECYYLKL